MDGTRSFWTRKYRQNIAKMIGVCYRYVPVREVAEDIAHDAFLTAIEKADTYKGIGAFDAWLMRITVNKVLAYLNEQRKSVPLEDDMPDTADEEEVSADEMMAAIRKADFSQEEIMEAIAQLRENHRTVLNLYVFERLNHPQIAKLLGISVNTSKSHLLRARRHLQELLFEKSKQKRHLLMFIFPLFNNTDKAFDSYCRLNMAGFAIPPRKPLTLADIPMPKYSSARLWIRVHTLPIATVGAVTAAAGCVLWAAHPHSTFHNTTPAPAPTEVTATTDSTANETESPQVTATPKSDTVPAVVRRASARHTPAIASTPLLKQDTTATASGSAAPVVVKKILRKNNRTVIVKDSTNHKP